MARGDKLLGKPCVVVAAHVMDGGSVRYAATGHCVLCSLGYSQSYNTEQRREYMRQWREIRKKLRLPTI